MSDLQEFSIILIVFNLLTLVFFWAVIIKSQKDTKKSKVAHITLNEVDFRDLVYGKIVQKHCDLYNVKVKFFLSDIGFRVMKFHVNKAEEKQKIISLQKKIEDGLNEEFGKKKEKKNEL